MLVRYFAAAEEALDRSEEHLSPADCAQAALDAGLTQEPFTIAHVIAHLRTQTPSAAQVLERCSFLVDAVATTELATPIAKATTLDVLPPFAGG